MTMTMTMTWAPPRSQQPPQPVHPSSQVSSHPMSHLVHYIQYLVSLLIGGMVGKLTNVPSQHQRHHCHHDGDDEDEYMNIWIWYIMLTMWMVRENQCKFCNGVAICKQDWFVIILSQWKYRDCAVEWVAHVLHIVGISTGVVCRWFSVLIVIIIIMMTDIYIWRC